MELDNKDQEAAAKDLFLLTNKPVIPFAVVKNATVQQEASSPIFMGYLLSFLAIAFIVLKLCHVIDWAWVWVLAPLWISVALTLVLIIVSLIIATIIHLADR